MHLRNVVTEPSIVQRATRLQEALESQTLAAFCDERSKETSNKPDEVANWKALQTLFQADSRDELVALLGFSKEEVASKVANAIDAFKTHTGGSSGSVKTSSSAGAQTSGSATVSEENESVPHEPSVTFAEQPNEASSESTTSAGPDAPSEVSGMSDANKAAESETTEPSLFGDDAVNVGGVDAAGADFFNSISGEGGAGARSALPERVLVPHANIAPGSSVAATAGSPGPSSIASENIKASTFRIYPSEESEADKLITRALVLGDFESAVSLCISSDRFADALLLAVRGGSDLLAKTQKAYFEKRTTTLPYLRLFQSIVSDDLTDVVQNADLNEWQEIFVVLCTFAKPDEFSNLAEQLGQRLEFQYASVRAAAGPADTANATKAKEFRKDAVLCYLAGGKLEKVAGMWIDEMKEEEAAIRSGQKTDVSEGSLYSARAEALQTFMEKITVFQNAVGYVDVDLQLPTESDIVAQTGARSYKLAALYDRIHEYVDLLSDQGLVEPALKYVNQTPADYRGGRTVGASTGDATADAARERLVQAGAARGIAKPAAPAAATASSSSYAPYDPYASARPAVPAAPSVPAAPLVNNSLDPYASAMPAAQPYAPAAPMSYAQPAQQQQPAYGGYSQPNAYSQPSVPSAYAPQSQPMVPPPPPMASQNLNAALPPPPPIKRDNSGWNDVPSDLAGPRRTTSAMGTKAQPITSPFPNSPAPSHPFGAQPGGALPPPPRGPTPSRSFASPPPQGPPGSGQYGPRPGAQQMGPPPVGRLGQGPVGPQAPPRGPGPQGSMPPSGPYGPAPTQMNAGPPQGPPGPYGPGPQRASQPSPAPGPYGPQPGMQGPLRPPTMVGPAGPGVPPGPPGPPGPPRIGTPAGGPIPGAGAGAPPRSATPSSKAAAPQSKYRKYSSARRDSRAVCSHLAHFFFFFFAAPGDRSHIPEASKPVFNVLSRELQRLRQNSPVSLDGVFAMAMRVYADAIQFTIAAATKAHGR